MNPNIINTLQELGLSHLEITLYLEILSKEESLVSSLAKKLSIKRDKTRYLCNKLVEKGMIVVLRRGKTFFYLANSPEKIILNLEQEKILLTKKQEKVQGVLNDLKNIMDPNIFLPIRSFHGLEGIIETYEDTLKDDNEILAFENIEKLSPELRLYLSEEYVPQRVKKRIFAKAIVPNNSRHNADSKLDKEHYRETRFLPEYLKFIELEINIYGKKVAIFSYQPQEMFSVILESPAFSNTLNTIFQFCWVNSRKVR